MSYRTGVVNVVSSLASIGAVWVLRRTYRDPPLALFGLLKFVTPAASLATLSDVANRQVVALASVTRSAQWQRGAAYKLSGFTRCRKGGSIRRGRLRSAQSGSWGRSTGWNSQRCREGRASSSGVWLRSGAAARPKCRSEGLAPTSEASRANHEPHPRMGKGVFRLR